ncbi:MAG: hypothetical protein VYE04_10825 [Pseudomonadota bacterium]|nr:hypothetical protein [Pseudomonadota bacterium]
MERNDRLQVRNMAERAFLAQSSVGWSLRFSDAGEDLTQIED